MKIEKNLLSVHPALFDTNAHAANVLPNTILKQWLESDQSEETATAMLAPYCVEGTVVCTDMSGLSKIAGVKDLIDTMAFVHLPKKLIAAYGRISGGMPVNRWVADNTMLYFPPEVSGAIVHSFITTIQNIVGDMSVPFSLGVYTGTMFKVHDSVFGTDLMAFEHVVEDDVPPHAIWVNRGTVERLGLDIDSLRSVENTPYFELDRENNRLGEPAIMEETNYPSAFTTAFHSLLDEYTDTQEVATKEKMIDQFQQEKTVIFLRHYGENTVRSTNASVLNNMGISCLWDTCVREMAESLSLEFVKTEGAIGIILASSIHNIDIHTHIFHVAKRYGFAISVGIDSGVILRFEDETISDVAGGPINIASKLAEDLGDKHTCYMVDSDGNHDQILSVSGVEIPVITLRE